MNFFESIKKDVETFLRTYPDFKNIDYEYDQDNITSSSFNNKNVPIIALTLGNILKEEIGNGGCQTEITRLLIITYNVKPKGTIPYDELDTIGGKIQLLIQKGMLNEKIFPSNVSLNFKDSPGSGKMLRISPNNRDSSIDSYGVVVNFELKYNLEDVMI